MQHVGGRHTARQGTVNRDLVWIDHVSYPHHRRHRHAPFVDRVGCDVRVGIDDSRHHELAGGIDHLGAPRHGHVPPDFRNLPITDEHRTVFDSAVGYRENRRVLNHRDR